MTTMMMKPLQKSFPYVFRSVSALKISKANRIQDQIFRSQLRSFSSNRAKAIVKPGVVIEVDTQPHKIKKITAGKRGKGGGYIRALLYNLISGQSYERTFLSDEVVKVADMQKDSFTYSWNDGQVYSFLNSLTFEECQVQKSEIEDFEFLVEGIAVKLLKFQDKVIGVQLPLQYDYEVLSFRNENTLKNEKLAVLNSGAEVFVPSFVEVGEKVRIDIEKKIFVARA